MGRHVRIVNETREPAPSLDGEALFGVVEDALGRRLESVTIVFIHAEKSAELNERYRHKTGPTNVLSFVQDREILLCLPVIEKEAQEHTLSALRWVQRLTVHGILHLEGFTHDTEEAAAHMEETEERILSRL